MRSGSIGQKHRDGVVRPVHLHSTKIENAQQFAATPQESARASTSLQCQITSLPPAAGLRARMFYVAQSFEKVASISLAADNCSGTKHCQAHCWLLPFVCNRFVKLLVHYLILLEERRRVSSMTKTWRNSASCLYCGGRQKQGKQPQSAERKKPPPNQLNDG